MSAKRSFIVPLLFIVLFALPAFAGDAASYVELADAPVIAVDWSKGAVQAVTLHGDRKLVFENPQKGGRYILILKQDAIGSRKVIWPSQVLWPGGPPQAAGLPADILTTTASRKDFLTFFYDGVSYDVLALSKNY